jgi:hypothetical protein
MRLSVSFILTASVLAQNEIAPHANFRLEYTPRTAVPKFTFIRNSSNGKGSLYSLQLDEPHAYLSNDISLVDIEGTPAAAGEAYGELLGKEAEATYNAQFAGQTGTVSPVITVAGLNFSAHVQICNT